MENRDTARMLIPYVDWVSFAFDNSTKKTSGCWEWNLHIGTSGYAQLRVGGKLRYMTRLILGIDGVSDVEALHSCDNKKCVNPEHLRAGTHTENMKEAIDRNRIPVGSARKNAKLTESDVDNILRAVNAGCGQQQIADQIGISRGTVSDVVCGRRWRWYTGR